LTLKLVLQFPAFLNTRITLAKKSYLAEARNAF